MVLDEPTNDLDIETLELLEENLQSFKGTILVVSHDRYFLDNIVTHTLYLDNNTIDFCVGGYSDWKAREDLKEKNYKKEIKIISAASKKIWSKKTYLQRRKSITLNARRGNNFRK